MNKIGIDFGTSFSSASWVNPATGRAESIRFNGESKIPSLVYFPGKGEKPLVGHAAYALFENCRKMGSSEEVEEVMAGMFTGLKRSMKEGMSHFLLDGHRVRHEELIAELFKYIKREAEALCFEGNAVDGVVITHPVEFENYKKEMLREAARLAGFLSVDLLVEPVAAAMGYMNSCERRKQGVLVYDFGGGTFDVAFVQFDEEGDFKILPPMGDPLCGGEDIDRLLYNRWNELSKKTHNRAISTDPHSIDKPFEVLECVRQKELMSMRDSRFDYNVILPPPGFFRLKMSLSREEWNDMIGSVVERTISLTRKMVDNIEKSNYAVQKVILIGGSSRIPLVQERLRSILPVEPQRVMDLDVAVAHGAALYTPRDLVMARDIHCIHCGTKISTANRFCWHCGKPNEYYDKRFMNK